ncbi:MAG: SPOR domain-containing protein [Alistipes sp.]|jgi:hypothetical protein|nr:SPOR domain-containing protein [Alistipes sp.]
MNSVDKIIFDALAARRTVVLPGVGSLEVKRRKPKRISETEIIPPQNVVVFSPHEIEGGDRIDTLLTVPGETGEHEAAAMYEAWLTEARADDGSVAIEDAGEIRDGRFVVAQPLHTTLNPANEEEMITMERNRNNGRLWLWLLVGLLAAALVVAGVLCWQKGMFECNRDSDAGIAAPVTEPVVDSIAEAAVEPVAEPVVEEPAGPRYHVIAGSFALESNADNYAAKLRREHPELTVEQFVNPRNGHNMVSIFSSPSETKAYNKMNTYWDIDLYLWVYKQK